MQKAYCINFDPKTIKRLENYSKKLSISRNAVIRSIINSFFLENRDFGEEKQT